MSFMNSRRVKKIVNNRLIPIKQKLDAIERRLKAYSDCPFCGFDQGKPDPYFGTGLTPTFMRLMKGVDTDAKTATETTMEGKVKFMNTINELQKKLTKLRREVQRSEAPKAGDTLEDQIRRRNEAIADGWVKKLDQEMMNELKTAGECILCGFKHPKLHPAFGTGVPKDVIDKLIKHPDLPLHVRVAKALELNPYKNANGWFDSGGHIFPDYPNDLVAAMGALEEYCLGKCFLDVQIFKQSEIPIWRVTIGHTVVVRDSLPQAICEAIVAHAEGR